MMEKRQGWIELFVTVVFGVMLSFVDRWWMIPVYLLGVALGAMKYTCVIKKQIEEKEEEE